MTRREELQKQAHEKLAQANRLIDEAGELAKEGQFHLHFGEIGDFIPKALIDRDLLRAAALEELKELGRHNGHDEVLNATKTAEYGWEFFDWIDRPRTPYADLTEAEVADALEKLIDDMIDSSEVPYEFREYCTAEDADCWWHPSRC